VQTDDAPTTTLPDGWIGWEAFFAPPGTTDAQLLAMMMRDGDKSMAGELSSSEEAEMQEAVVHEDRIVLKKRGGLIKRTASSVVSTTGGGGGSLLCFTRISHSLASPAFLSQDERVHVHAAFC
jgi:hypothetical protein